jgi:hypothetical protein
MYQGRIQDTNKTQPIWNALLPLECQKRDIVTAGLTRTRGRRLRNNVLQRGGTASPHQKSQNAAQTCYFHGPLRFYGPIQVILWDVQLQIRSLGLWTTYNVRIEQSSSTNRIVYPFIRSSHIVQQRNCFSTTRDNGRAVVEKPRNGIGDRPLLQRRLTTRGIVFTISTLKTT